MSKAAMIKDLEKWFHARVKQAMKDLTDRADIIELTDGETAAILGGELIHITAELFAVGTVMEAEKAGEMFATGITLIRQFRAAKQKGT